MKLASLGYLNLNRCENLEIDRVGPPSARA